MTNDQHNPGPDDQLADELRGFFVRTDPVPADVVDAARAAIEFRDLDAQLAELLADSALEDKELAGVRGLGQRLLTFGVGDRFLELDVATTGAGRDLSGYVLPSAPGQLRVEGPGGVVEGELDAQGRFRLERVPSGPLRVWIQIAGLKPLRTPWLAL